ncbi:uncharacterized protein LOC121745999 [Salvia splendens]|uniref:uncharacterized protein LOC121745999 n=1 Tax=Salvia splendens TaxID=180675 RepID=UPI001C27BF58|nr:uncharacterized protein LOC121745999 [Salvia splendens]
MNGRGGRAQPPPAEDTSSPYFLHPSDNPSVVLVPQPNREDLLYQPWARCNSMVIAWLRNSVSSQICSSIMYLDDAYEIWSDLKERFSLGDSARLYQLRQQLMSSSQGNSGHQENDCTMQFLIGLNPSFSQIGSHIVSITPLPSLSKVFALVIQEERQRHIEGNLSSTTYSTPPIPSEQPFVNTTSNYGRGLNKFSALTMEEQITVWISASTYTVFPLVLAEGRVNHQVQLDLEDLVSTTCISLAEPIAHSSLTPTPELAAHSSNPFSSTISFSSTVNSIKSSCSRPSTWILDTGATHHEALQGTLTGRGSCVGNLYIFELPESSSVGNQNLKHTPSNALDNTSFTIWLL